MKFEICCNVENIDGSDDRIMARSQSFFDAVRFTDIDCRIVHRNCHDTLPMVGISALSMGIVVYSPSIVFWFQHDTTILALLGTLGLYYGQDIPYASAVLVELYENTPG